MKHSQPGKSVECVVLFCCMSNNPILICTVNGLFLLQFPVICVFFFSILVPFLESYRGKNTIDLVYISCSVAMASEVKSQSNVVGSIIY